MNKKTPIEMNERDFDEKIITAIETRRPIHPWRWKVLTIWIICFTFAVGYSVRSSRHSIDELNEAKASITQLEHTNCGLRNFLLTAKKARLKTAAESTGKQRKANLQAAKGYQQLVKPFENKYAIGDCPVPLGLNGGD